MIQQGIQMLVQADATVTGLCPAGGFYASLPKDKPRPNWTYAVISSTKLSQTLSAQKQVVEERWQIDVFGDTGASVLQLAEAIDNVLENYSGTLPDPDATSVQWISRENLKDYFDDTARSYRRSIDYMLTFTR